MIKEGYLKLKYIYDDETEELVMQSIHAENLPIPIFHRVYTWLGKFLYEQEFKLRYGEDAINSTKVGESLIAKFKVERR